MCCWFIERAKGLILFPFFSSSSSLDDLRFLIERGAYFSAGLVFLTICISFYHHRNMCVSMYIIIYKTEKRKNGYIRFILMFSLSLRYVPSREFGSVQNDHMKCVYPVATGRRNRKRKKVFFIGSLTSSRPTGPYSHSIYA